MLDVILEGFKLDLVEMEQGGPNKYHDPAVNKKSTFDQILEACWEQRLKVNPLYGDSTSKGKDEPLPVSLALIREDVWQTLINLNLPHWREEVSIKVYKEQITEFIESYPVITKPSDFWENRFHRLHSEHFTTAYLKAGGNSPFYLKLYEHFMLLQGYDTEKYVFNHKPLPPEFTQVAIEFSYIMDLTYSLCYVWHPSYTIGGQTANHDLQREYHMRLAEISKVADDKQKERWK